MLVIITSVHKLVKKHSHSYIQHIKNIHTNIGGKFRFLVRLEPLKPGLILARFCLIIYMTETLLKQQNLTKRKKKHYKENINNFTRKKNSYQIIYIFFFCSIVLSAVKKTVENHLLNFQMPNKLDKISLNKLRNMLHS